jgi:hypothetical protein
MRKPPANPRGPQQRLSLWPLTPEEALRIALSTPLKDKPKRRKQREKEEEREPASGALEGK